MQARTNNSGDFLGNYTEEWLLQNPDIDWQLVAPCFENFVKKHWNGSQWVEAATLEEISINKTPVYMSKLQDIVTNLRIRAKGAAIGKTGTNAYILAQVEFYEIKFQQCSNENNPPEVESLLQNEADEFEISLEDFKVLVITMYNAAKEKYNLFMRMIERCRTKIQTLIEQNNFENADTAFSIVETLKNADEAETVMSEILNL